VQLLGALYSTNLFAGEALESTRKAPMIAFLLALAVTTPQEADSTVFVQTGIRNPTISVAGRLAYESEGDLWVSNMDIGSTSRLQEAAAGSAPSFRSPVQITSGAGWDRQPAWGADGETLVFSSDRSGSVDLWSVRVGADGSVGRPTALTFSDETDGEPTVGEDGTIVFARGQVGATDLWVLSPDGNERQLTSMAGAEASPVISPSGRSVAYVSVLGRRRQLRVAAVRGGEDRLIVEDMAIEYPSWAPSGDALTFTTRSGNRGVWIAPLDGGYVNMLDFRPAKQAWSPDSHWLILASLPRADVGYNGDPRRLGSVPGRDELSGEGSLRVIPAPKLPGSNTTEISLSGEEDRSTRNGERFDRFWNRINDLYFSWQGGEAWEGVAAEYRSDALRAATDSALDEVIYDALRRRPHLREEVEGRAAVSSAHWLASAAGAEILGRGGNVIDAAVATSFAVGVVEPDASGIGGYGEMVLSLTDMEEPVVIEFLTRVPEQAGLGNASLLENGSLPVDGPVLANIPGTVAGMWKAWQEYGSGNLEWSDLLQPAIRLADDGFVLDEAFTTTLARERHRFEKYRSSMEVFFPNGEPLQPGDTLRNPDLAWTLREIAAGGAEAFYRGEIARRVVRDLRGLGNAMTLNDMARYFANEREPISGTYHGHTIYSAAPAAGGGVSLVTKLNLLGNVESTGLYRENTAAAHAMIEAWKLTPTTFGRMGDPSLWPVDLDPILDVENAERTWQQCFDPERATGPSELRRNENGEPVCVDGLEVGFSWGEELGECVGGDEPGCRSSGTTAFTVADADGNIVAVTQTLGTWGGNFYVSPGLGFLYNDKLRSYRTDPDAYGARLPYARHGTSIAPTIVFEGTGDSQRPRFAVAAAGNAWITSAVYQMLVAMVDQGLGPQDALELPRFLVRTGGFGTPVREIVVQMEDGYSPEVMRELRRLGHDIQLISLRGELRMGYGAAVRIDGGKVRAGGDPRRSGGASAVP
jgi:gamma-glutamyltranspeptidase